jgi:sugar lactone lactonase YvrE
MGLYCLELTAFWLSWICEPVLRLKFPFTIGTHRWHRIWKKLHYRHSVAALNNPALDGQQLAGQVQDLGNISNTDGMEFDAKGNLYLGDPITYSMVQMTPDLKPHTWIRDSKRIWPNTYNISKDGYIFITTRRSTSSRTTTMVSTSGTALTWYLK